MASHVLKRYIYKVFYTLFTMSKQYKMLRIDLSSWNRLRRVFYGRKDETLSDYIDRIVEVLNDRT